MYQKNPLLEAIMSIIALIVVITLAVVGVILFSYLLLVGAIIGLVLYIVAAVRFHFFKRYKRGATTSRKPDHVIDVDFTKFDDK